MNKFRITLALLAIVLVFSVTLGSTVTLAQQSDPRAVQLTEQKIDLIEENLVMALARDDVPGLQASAALVLRDIKRTAPRFNFNSSTIPLMRIVKNENADRMSRVAAALALFELGSNIGDFAIRRTGEFTDDGHVKHICQSLIAERQRTSQREDSEQ